MPILYMKMSVEESVLDQFNSLSRSGALGDLDSLRRENRELDLIITDAAALFAVENEETMISFFISRLLDRFIPTYLVFLVEPPRGGELSQWVYRNLKPTSARFPEAAWPSLKKHFSSQTRMQTAEDMADLEGQAGFGEDFRAFDPRLFLPLHGIGGFFGLVILGPKLVGGEYGELELMYLERMSRFLSIGIQNSLDYHDAITDAKTGLYNHAHYLRRLEEEIARVGRGHGKAGVVMLDIDYFKRFNDTWGHLAGDEILLAIARAIKESIRAEDVGSRFGGEEFAVLAIGCDPGSLFELCERLRAAIESLKVVWKSEILSVTASIGCCMIDDFGHHPATVYIDRADKALYLSKTMGRNRTTYLRGGLLQAAEGLLSGAGGR